MATPDGSIARRFAVLALLVALAVAVAMSLRKGRIPGTAAGPSRRIIGITDHLVHRDDVHARPSGRTTSACSPGWPGRWAHWPRSR